MSTDRAERLRRRAAVQYGLNLVASGPARSADSGATALNGATNLVAGFAVAVRRHGERTAVRCGAQQLSYRELDTASDGLAAAIRAHTDDLRRPVAILLDRSTQLVVAALAVLKTGSCYVPLDPATPATRIGHILQDAAPALAVTSAEPAGLLPEDLPILLADQFTGQRATPVHEPSGSGSPIGSATRAYLIFTSGTTGRPKGVAVTHGNVLRLFTGTESLFGFGCHDVWSQFHSFGFDFSVWEMWGALLYGGCVVMVPDDVAKDPARFRRLLSDEQVTVLNQTPTAFKQLIAEDLRHSDRLAVTRVIFSGEALHFGDLRAWVDKYGDDIPELINMYGITETTVHASYRRVRRVDLDRRASLIGHPLPDLDFHLVDERLAPVAPGELGEIVVTGPGVTGGYLDRPELTRQRFVELTDAAGTVVRGYRSGDLARLTSTGEFEYHGRRDDQVKIRGFRVELGEVCSALRTLAPVADAVVVARTLPELGASLVAYVVPSGSGETSTSAIRLQLARLLPEYMIPAVVVVLESFPLTPHGKVDRRALPDPPGTDPPGGQPAAEPQDEVEATILAILATLLPRSPVSPTAPFFDLGGHSLLAVQFLARVRDGVGVEVALQDFLRSPTVRGLAGMVRDQVPTAVRPPASSGRPDGPGLFPLRRDRDAATAVFALPGALGFGSAFVQISAYLTGHSCYAVETRDVLISGRPAPERLIEECARTIAEAATGRDVHLVGHSLGGRLAVHLVSALRTHGVRTTGVALLDPAPPTGAAVDADRGRLAQLRAFFGHIEHFFPATARERAGTLFVESLAPTAVDALLTQAQQLIDPGGAALLGHGLHTEFDHYLRTIRLHWPEPEPVDCPALLLTAERGPGEPGVDPPAPWRHYLPVSLVHRQLAASHDGMLRHPHAQLVASCLVSFFARHNG